MITKDVYWLAVRVLLALGLTLLAVNLRASENTTPIVHILAVDPCGAEQGQDTAAFTVFRDGPTNNSLTVEVQFGGNAINGVDYQRLGGTVTIPAGARRAPIVVTPIDDNIIEGTEVVLAYLPQPLTWPLPYIVCWPSLAYAHIEDNDFPPTNHPPFVRIVSPSEGDVFVAPADITITAQASDRDGRVRTVEFFAGTNSLGIVSNYPIVRPLPVALDADLEDTAEAEPERYPDLDLNPASIDAVLLSPFRLTWHDAPPGEHVLTAVATDNHGDSSRSEPVTIKVTERPLQPVVTVTAPDPMAAEPDPTSSRLDTATFRIHRSGNTDLPLTVYYRLGGTASNGVDYQELPYSATIPRGARTTDVIVEPIDDNLVEGTEKVVITIVPPICIAIWPPPPDCYLVGRPSSARAAIHDNDIVPGNLPPLVEIVRPLDGSIFRAPATIPIVAQARDPDGRVLTVEFFEGTNSLGIVTNDPGVITTSRPPFLLVWSNVPPGRYVLTAQATDNDGAIGRSRPVDIKVVDIAPPPVVTITTTDAEGAETGPIAGGDTAIINPAAFMVHRTGGTGRPLLVYYSLSGSAVNGVDYRRLSGEVTIPVGASSAPIQVLPIDDNLCEGTETVVATVEPPICIAIYPPPPECYVVGDPRQARAVIRDNDVCPTNQPPKVAIVRPMNGDIFTAPADIAIYAEANDSDGRVLSVEFFANGTSIGVVSNSPSNTDQLFRLLWSNVGVGGYRLTARAKDNGGAMTTSAPVDIKVIELVRTPVVTIEAIDPYASEGGRPFLTDASVWPEINDVATFVVKRDRATNHALVVYYSLGGTAENGYDYAFLRGHVTIPVGEWGARITVEPLDDNLVEGTETVIATLEPIACPRVIPPPPECYVVGEPARAIAFIRDNDFSNALPKVEIVQPQNGETFAAPADIKIEVVTRDPDGWVQTVQFFAGTNKIGEQSIFFIQPPPPGQVQKFSMIWSNVPPGAYSLTAIAIDNRGGSSRSDPIAIKVLDPCRLPVVTIEAVDRFAAEQDPRIDSLPDTATFRVKRTCVVNTPLTVFLDITGTASNGVDYLFLREHVTIPGGAPSADIVVEALDDLLVEGVETVVVRIESPVCLATDPAPAGCYLVGRPSQDIAYIRDNDQNPNLPPRVEMVNPPDGSTFEAPADILLIASASDADGWVHTVEFFEGTNSLGIVTNNPLILDPTRDIAVSSFENDSLARPINPFQLKWLDVPPGHYRLSALATDNRGASTKSEPIEIKVVERPGPPIVTVIARDPIASEGPQDPTADRAPDNAVFTVIRRGPTNFPLTVFYRLGGTAINGVDYRELPHTVVIPTGARTANVIVQPIDDSLVEGTEKVLITIVEPVCIDIFPQPLDCYLVGRNHSARAAILDNDTAPNDPPQVRLVQPQDGSVFIAPADIRLLAQAFDSDGRIKQVEFFEGTNSLGVVTDPLPYVDSLYPLYALGWSNVPPGHYVLTAVATDDAGESTPSEPVEIKVVERIPPPVVTITAPDPEAAEQDPRSVGPRVDNATFTVHRTGPTNDPLTVFYRVGGSASNAVDYEFLGGHVTIPAGTRTADIIVQPIDDLRCEGDESVVIGLLPPISVAVFPPVRDNYIVGDPGRARAVIHDNDVCPSNQPPKVAIIRPQDGDVFVAPADIRVCAEAKDADGRVVRVDFYADNTLIGSVSPPSSNTEEIFCIAWPNVRPGGYVLTAVATDDDGATTRSEPVRIRVIDRPERPVVTIRATDPVGAEPSPGAPQDIARFTVSRDCCTTDALVVYFTITGTAENGVDYDFVRGHVTIPQGQSSANVVIDPIDDNLIEGTETVVATLQPPVCIAIWPPPPDCYQVGAPSRAVAYIRDNDSSPNIPPQVAILNPSEGAAFVAPANITITSVALDPDGWVPLVEFFEGTNKIGESHIVFIQEPPPGEIQIHTFDWNNVPPGRYTLTAKATDNLGGSTVSGPIHITVVDSCGIPVVTVHAADPIASEGNPDDTATFIVRRTCPLDEPMLVYYAVTGTAENGVDYWRLSGEVLFPAGDDAARIVVHPIDDSLIEGTETVIVTLVQPRCLNTDPQTPGCYLVGSLAGRASAYLRDNDFQPNLPPRVAIVRPRAGSIFHVPEDIHITAKTRDADGWVTTMQFYEGTNQIGGLAILVSEPPPPGEIQTFNFTWTDVRPGRYVLRAKATDNDGASTWSGPVEITVVDSTHPPVVTIYSRDCYAVEGANPPNTATFVVRRSGPTNAPLTVHYAIGGTALNGTDYVSIPTSVTIPAGSRGARIVINPIDDRALERAETVIIELHNAALYNVGRPGRAGAIIVDNDYRQPPTVCFADRIVGVCLPRPLALDTALNVNLPIQSYRLEASTDLIEWAPVDYNACLEDYIHFVDTDAPDHKMRFYRVMEDFDYPDDE